MGCNPMDHQSVGSCMGPTGLLLGEQRPDPSLLSSCPRACFFFPFLLLLLLLLLLCGWKTHSFFITEKVYFRGGVGLWWQWKTANIALSFWLTPSPLLVQQPFLNKNPLTENALPLFPKTPWQAVGLGLGQETLCLSPHPICHTLPFGSKPRICPRLPSD